MKFTFKCNSCNETKEIKSDSKAENPICEKCGKKMVRIFSFVKPDSMDNDMCEIGRRMSYHSNTNN